MKIYNNNNINNIYDIYKSTVSRTVNTKKTNNIDKVEISSNVSNVNKNFAEYEQLREKKVQDIKEKVDSGAYYVKSDEVAESILKGVFLDKKI